MELVPCESSPGSTLLHLFIYLIYVVEQFISLRAYG